MAQLLPHLLRKAFHFLRLVEEEQMLLALLREHIAAKEEFVQFMKGNAL